MSAFEASPIIKMDAISDSVSACAVRIVQKMLTLLVEVSGRQSQASPSPNFPNAWSTVYKRGSAEDCEGRGTK